MAEWKKDTPDDLQQAVARALGASTSVRAAMLAGSQWRDMMQSPMSEALRSIREQMEAGGAQAYLRELRAANEHIKPLVGAEHFRGIGAAIQGAMSVDPDLLSGSLAKVAQESKLFGDHAGQLSGLKFSLSADALGLAAGKSLFVGEALRESIGRSASLFASLQIPDYAKDLGRLSGMAVETDSMFAALNLSHGLADRLALDGTTRALLEHATGRLNRAYAGFASSLASRPEWLGTAPDFIARAPGDMVFSHARFVSTVTTHEVEEETTDAGMIWTDVQTGTLAYIDAVLPEVSPGLMRAWSGVWHAARRRGPDWARHAAFSLRFVLIQTLDTVAPKGALTDVPRQYLHDGKPTREAQIHWLCAPVNNRTYRRVARADLDSAISIIDAMSEAVHRDDYVEIEDAFDTMAIRSAVALSNLLKLWKARQ